jgi:hypothetical protein
MTDLISREALIQQLHAIGKRENNLGRVALVCECIDKAKEAPAIEPKVVANISGGILQGASSDHRVDLHVLDFDLDSISETCTGIEIDGDRCYHANIETELDPDFISQVIEAEAIHLDDGSPANA